MKEHLPEPQMRRTRLAPPGWLLLGSIVMASIQAQLPDLKIGVDSIRLTWAATGEECIVVCAESPDGPWTPVPVPIREVDGLSQAIVKCSDQQQYFRLKEGTCFVEGFEDENLEGWDVLYHDAGSEGVIQPEVTCWHLRIHGPSEGFHDPLVFLYRTDRILGDFALSIDILSWHEEPGRSANVFLFGRLDPAFTTLFPDPPDPSGPVGYFGGFGGQLSADPQKSVLTFFHGTLASVSTWPFPKTDPTRRYRLVFTGVGNQLTLRLYELSNRRLLHQAEKQYEYLADGLVGFYVVHRGITTDFRLDNFIAVGTMPE